MPPGRPSARARSAQAKEPDVFDFAADDVVEPATPPRRRNKRSIIDLSPVKNTSTLRESSPPLSARELSPPPPPRARAGRKPQDGGKQLFDPNPSALVNVQTAPSRRGPGRPRKEPPADESIPARRGPGRPRKEPLADEPAPAKKGPGRPRKEPLPDDSPPAKRRPGRPRKEKLADESSPARRGPGRPRKEPSTDESTPARRGPGRPRKEPPAEESMPLRRESEQSREEQSAEESLPARRRPGRPRKEPAAEASPPVNRGPGRPRKVSAGDSSPVRRGPGRPRKEPVADESSLARRGPGRPRKEPAAEASPPVNRRPGRPRKVPLADESPPAKRGPGRPRKGSTDESTPVRRGPRRPCKEPPADESPPAKRGPGRPRKEPSTDESAPARRGRGRPRKEPPSEESPPARRRGRPRKSPVSNVPPPAHDEPERIPQAPAQEDTQFAHLTRDGACKTTQPTSPEPVSAQHESPEESAVKRNQSHSPPRASSPQAVRPCRGQSHTRTASPADLPESSPESLNGHPRRGRSAQHEQSPVHSPDTVTPPKPSRSRRGRSEQRQVLQDLSLESTSSQTLDPPREQSKLREPAAIPSPDALAEPEATRPRPDRSKQSDSSPELSPGTPTPILHRSSRSISAVESAERSQSDDPALPVRKLCTSPEASGSKSLPTTKAQRLPGRPRKQASPIVASAASLQSETHARRAPWVSDKIPAQSASLLTARNTEIPKRRAVGRPRKTPRSNSPSPLPERNPAETERGLKRKQSPGPSPAPPTQSEQIVLPRRERSSARISPSVSSPPEQDEASTRKRTLSRSPSPAPCEQETRPAIGDALLKKMDSTEDVTKVKRRSRSSDMSPSHSPDRAPTRREPSPTSANALPEHQESQTRIETEPAQRTSHRIQKQHAKGVVADPLPKRLYPATKKRKLVDAYDSNAETLKLGEHIPDAGDAAITVKKGSENNLSKISERTTGNDSLKRDNMENLDSKKLSDGESDIASDAEASSDAEQTDIDIVERTKGDSAQDVNSILMDIDDDQAKLAGKAIVNQASFIYAEKATNSGDEALAEDADVGDYEKIASGNNEPMLVDSLGEPNNLMEDVEVGSDGEIANAMNDVSDDPNTREENSAIEFSSNLSTTPASDLKEAKTVTQAAVVEAHSVANSRDENDVSNSIALETVSDIICDSSTNVGVKRIDQDCVGSSIHKKSLDDAVTGMSSPGLVAESKSNAQCLGTNLSDAPPMTAVNGENMVLEKVSSETAEKAPVALAIVSDVIADAASNAVSSSVEKSDSRAESSKITSDKIAFDGISCTAEEENGETSVAPDTFSNQAGAVEHSAEVSKLNNDDVMPTDTTTVMDEIMEFDAAQKNDGTNSNFNDFLGLLSDASPNTSFRVDTLVGNVVDDAKKVMPCTSIAEPGDYQNDVESKSIAIGVVSDIITDAASYAERSVVYTKHRSEQVAMMLDGAAQKDSVKNTVSSSKDDKEISDVATCTPASQPVTPAIVKEPIAIRSQPKAELVANKNVHVGTQVEKATASNEVMVSKSPFELESDKKITTEIRHLDKQANTAIASSEKSDINLSTENDDQSPKKVGRSRRAKRSILSLTDNSSSRPDSKSVSKKNFPYQSNVLETPRESDEPEKSVTPVPNRSLLQKRPIENSDENSADTVTKRSQTPHKDPCDSSRLPSDVLIGKNIDSATVATVCIEPCEPRRSPLLSESPNALSAGLQPNQSLGSLRVSEAEVKSGELSIKTSTEKQLGRKEESNLEIDPASHVQGLEELPVQTKSKKKTVTFAECPTEIPPASEPVESMSSPSLQGLGSQEHSDASSSLSSLSKEHDLLSSANNAAHFAGRLLKRPASHEHQIAEGATGLDHSASISVSGRKPPRLAKRRRVRFDPLPEMTSRPSNNHSVAPRRGSLGQPAYRLAIQNVATKPRTLEEERTRRALLDQFQYLLDGAFQQGKGKRTSTESDNKLKVDSLLQMLRLLRQTPQTAARPGAAQPDSEDNDAVLIVCLREQPALVQKLVQNLLHLHDCPTPIPLLAMAILLVIVQGTGTSGLFSEMDVESLVEVFFRFSSLPTSSQRANQDRHLNEPRRRGWTPRRKESSSKKENVLDVVKEMLSDENLVSSIPLDPFSDEVQCANVVAGFVLSKVLEGSERARDAMMLNNRLARIAKVMYIASSAMSDFVRQLREEDKLIAEGAEPSPLYTKKAQKKKEARTLMGVAMRIFESATLHEDAQKRLVEESKVTSLTVKCVREILCVDELSEAEGVASCAIRLCINLTQGGSLGLTQFLNSGGVQVALDCLAREAGAGLPDVPEQRMFDVRVLCLALLSSVVDQSQKVRESFQDMAPSNTRLYEGGALAFILSLLKGYGNSAEPVDTDLYEDHRLQGGTSDAPESKDEMEKRVSTGYLCLVLGALVQDCRRNSTAIRRAIPGNCLLTLAGVIHEFLDFHHEIGLFSENIDAMYDRITNALNEEEMALKQLLTNSDDTESQEPDAAGST